MKRSTHIALYSFLFCFHISLQSTTIDRKIAQSIIMGVPINPEPSVEQLIIETVERYQPGGIIFLGSGTIEQQQLFIRKLQQVVEHPLLITQDCEWGTGMRLLDGHSFPKNYIVGYANNQELTYEYAQAVACECRKLGIHINYAPVLDINSNPHNMIIGTRAFGSSKETVNACGTSYINAFNQAGVLCCAKHFPGHGDTVIDSHVALPTITKSLDELESGELYPFKKAIEAGIPCIMMGHLLVPALDATLPASLSPLIHNYLRTELGFQGLIISDALNMGAIVAMMPQYKAAAQALKAGSTMIILTTERSDLLKEIGDESYFFTTLIPQAIAEIKKEISLPCIEANYEKIIAIKNSIFHHQKSGQTARSPQEISNDMYYTALNKQIIYDITTWHDAFQITQENYQSITPTFLEKEDHFVASIAGIQKGFNFAACTFDNNYKLFILDLIQRYNDKLLLIVYASLQAAEQFQASHKLIAFEDNVYIREALKKRGILCA